MQKYKDNVTTSSGSALRNVAVFVLAEDGSIANIFQDRYGSVAAANPLTTASDGTYSFYAANGRYSLRCIVEGVRYLDDDVVLLDDPSDVSAGSYAYPLATQQQAESQSDATPLTFTPTRIWQAIAKWWAGITVPVTQGGTGAANAQGARIALGVDYGTTAGSVAAGNDQRINDGETAFTWGNHALAGYATHAEVAPKLENITGLVLPGTNIAISGSGTNAAPYVIDSGGAAGALWGAIGGTLSSQSDLSAALAAKADSSSLGTAATKDVQVDSLDTTPGRLMTVEAFGIGVTAASSIKPILNPQSISEWDQPVGSHWFIMETAALLPEAGQYYNATVIARRDNGDVITWLAANYVTGQTFIGTANFTAGTLVWRKLWDSSNLNPASFATAAQGAKADSALQSETDPTVPAWAKAATKPGYTKAEVGLGNVDNTSDVDKPISTAQLTLNPQAFSKADPYSVAFLKTAASTVSIKAGTYIMVAGTMVSFAAQTPVIMPALTAGTDYAIYACADGSIRADASFTAPTGYTTANSRQIGGFHYAPGGNAPGRAGGDTAPAINEYSLWDLKWRPACIDPRGMTLVANNFWADIYLTGVDHIANGTSKYNVTIADGASPPKVPLEFGGDGSLAYGSMTWWEAAEVARSHGKQLPTYDQFAALAFGTTEATSSGGTDVPTTGQTGAGATAAWNVFTSKWGVIQSSGCIWTWGREFAVNSSVNAGFNWQAETAGRGAIYENGPASVVAALFGSAWFNGAVSGSRASYWSYAPSGSVNNVGLRCVRDHLILV